MNLFNIDKKKQKAKKSDENSDFSKPLKRNINNKIGSNQQDLIFKENTAGTVLKSSSGSKQGLSYNLEDISNEQVEILKKCGSENSATELMKILKRSNKTKFKQTILEPLVNCGFFNLTIPEKPTSPKQKYRFTGLFVKKLSK
ncbi:MAG: hypothetical protein HAW58_03365 [Candidatus Thioglobus sp.]|nr:hypothetical protein [Candidatus Thioglobus sp.]